MEITDHQLERVIEKAFYKGLNWGHVYISWFEPSQEDHDKKLKEATRDIKRNLKRW